MNLWNEALDALGEAEAGIEKKGLAPTDDQLLKIAEVKALLSVGQELSRIHHESINPEYSSGA